MSSTDDEVEHYSHNEENTSYNENSHDWNDRKVSQGKSIGVVQSRRGRWVIKLAVALFLMRRGITDIAELGQLHSEFWRHESLGIESSLRGYVEEGTNLFTAESVWKRKLGCMWLEQGFEACEEELEPYFIKEFAKHRLCMETEKDKRNKNETSSSLDGHMVNSNNNNMDSNNNMDNNNNVCLTQAAMTVVKMEEVQQMVKLYKTALQYVRSVEFVENEKEQGWIPAAQLFTYLQKKHCLPVKDNDTNITHNINSDNNNNDNDTSKNELGVQLPTTPEELLSLLQRLDILGRLQFYLNSHDTEETTTETTEKTEGTEKTREYCTRATWAYKDNTIDAAVIVSHPKFSLPQALQQFSPSVALYDFVENVNLWRQEIKKYGGRVIPLFRPFLLLVPGDSLHQYTNNDNINNNNNNTTTIGVSAFVASKMTHKSAFIRISQTFIQLHQTHYVRVIQSLFNSNTKESSSTTPSVAAVMLLPVDQIDTAAITTYEGSDVYSVRASLLYASGGDSNIAIEALCPTTLENTCSTENTADKFPCYLTKKTLYLEELPVVEGINKLMTLKGGLRFNTAVARNSLRWIAHECKLSQDILGSLPLGVLCGRWLLTNTKLLLHDNCHPIITSAIRNNEFNTVSLTLPWNEPDSEKLLCGRRVETRHLNNELEASEYFPLRVLSKHQKCTITIYYSKNINRDQIITTPLLVLHRLQHRMNSVQMVSNEKETKKSHLAVLILPLNADDRDCDEKENKIVNECRRTTEIGCSNAMMDYIAIEIDKEEAQQWLCNDNNNSNHNNNDSDSDRTLYSADILVDEWVLIAASPIAEYIESEFLLPVEQSLRTPHMNDNPFAQFSKETQNSLLQSLREQLLIAVTPGKNEALEYLGDAMLDFLIVQKELDEWKCGALVRGTSNKTLATFLPDAVSQHLSLMFGISNEKRKADVVEALIGAVVQALWVIPRQGENMSSTVTDNTIGINNNNNNSNISELRYELLPFKSVIQAARAMMAVMQIK